ncbi:MAG TPA: ABC transporter substrate-binding protein [Acidimicrobiales bacterium]|jgi:ABC-type branched-subunit amino acid transport system substrate-binding protein|nr:ABC transporter substrate-binding protein [Acidimicrobiales bacterium]
MTDTQRVTRRDRAGHTVRRLLAGTLITGTLVLAGGTVGVTTAAAAGAGAPLNTSTTCPSASKLTPAEAASTTGVTKNSITVGNVSIVSGPVPGLFEGASIGTKAYFDYINSTKGGVNGRKLMVNGVDDAFSGETNRTETQDAVASDFGLVGSFSLFDSYGCKALAQNPGVPDVSVTLDPVTNALPNVFSAQPLAVGSGLGPLQYYKKHFPKDTTVGTIVSNVQTSLSQWTGQKAALEHEGYHVAYVRDVGPTETDFTTDVISMRNDNVNAVDLTAVDWQVGAEFVQNAAAQGWHPGLIFSAGPIYADQFVSHAGGPAATNGIQIGQAQALYLGQDANTIPADKLFLSYVKKVSPSWTPDLFTLYGWASAALFVQALQGAGTNPTRGSVLTQLKKITSFNAGGLIAPANPAQKKPASCYVMMQIKNGNYVRTQPAKSGFSCDSTYFYANAT